MSRTKTTRWRSVAFLIFSIRHQACHLCFLRTHCPREAALKRRNAVAAELGLDFIDVRVREVKDAYIAGLPMGEVPALGDYELIVKRGIYGHGESVQDTCPKCS